MSGQLYSLPSVGPSKKVVIVGGGLAGLAAAHTLSSTLKNVNLDIKLLEAKPYPGGRAKSVPIQDGRYFGELGACFLYYFNKATNFTDFLESRQLASNKSAESHNEIFTDTGIPNIHFLSNGEEIQFSSAKHYEKMFAEVVDELCECYDKKDWNYVIRKEWPKTNKTYLPPKEYLEARYFEVVEASAAMQLPTGCTPRHIYNRMIIYERFMNGAYLANLDASAYGDYLDPDCEYLQRANYSEIVSAISKELPPDTLQCSNVVKAINWTDKAANSESDIPPITVHCENGQVYDAHHVIVTTSLGVLKLWASINETFSPSLPADKLEAISKLGMGEGCSVFFEFSAPLIDKEHRVIELFWLEEELQYLSKYPWAQSLDIMIRQKDSNVYLTWFAADKARGIEAATNQERIEGISLVLEKFLKKRICPTRVIIGAWTSDPHVLGVYSYCAKGSGEMDRVALSKPVDGSTSMQLLFAGEATHVSMYGTTNGAFESGLREAKRLLEHYSI
ncbi:peroxisomal N(1)-acetyl-spermine/spermidine oxidase-like [Halichondria panicea]|uniref:peroxisomal N(1)-acetyl-spermine/spermidine oxidase-like n=1 Tax=Halichondria panicea TaxID=6063 RepID=UPI00312B3CFC